MEQHIDVSLTLSFLPPPPPPPLHSFLSLKKKNTFTLKAVGTIEGI